MSSIITSGDYQAIFTRLHHFILTYDTDVDNDHNAILIFLRFVIILRQHGIDRLDKGSLSRCCVWRKHRFVSSCARSHDDVQSNVRSYAHRKL